MQIPMRSGQRGKSFGVFAAFASLAAISACTSGGGDDGPDSGLKITNINLTNGAVWKINRQIRVSFNQPINFSSVSSNSFTLQRVGGGPATVEFSIDPNDANSVLIQPRCPTMDDLSDAGLLAGGDPNNGGLPYSYELNILGIDHSTLPVQSTTGDSLRVSDTRQFTTPTSTNPLDLYIDTKVGPPRARVIQASAISDPSSAQELNSSSYVEIAQDATTGLPKRYYFKRVGGTTYLVDTETVPPSLAPALPLNKLSDPASQLSLVIAFDQAVDPSTANISDSRIHWEFLSDPGASPPTWSTLPISLTLDENCTPNGAKVRVKPLGLLPPSAQMRGVVTPLFVDIVGESNLLQDDDFAPADTEIFPLSPPELADNYLEDFDTSVNDDATFLFPEPHALWGNGELSATFSFTGTGGTNGAFDWVLPQGTTVIFNTSITTITGYQIIEDSSGAFLNFNGPFNNQTSIGGIIDVDDLWIQDGAILKFEGPNPVMLLAKGTIRIDGSIVVNGTSTNGVTTLNTTGVPESGAAGQAGGGKGGTGSPLTTASSPKGGNGFGAFNVADAGGTGGETGWSLFPDINKRRGAGGGGGRLGKDVPNLTTAIGAFDQRLIGLDAEKGFDSALTDNGATTGSPGPFGGPAGAGPFVDPDATNDFYGTMFDVVNQRLIAGELSKPWAGSGGGGGGNAAKLNSGTFPGPWIPTGDEKGSGGGGGAGSLHVQALGDIVFGANGQLLCRGGLGGGGENTIFLNRVGGGSGGGSGGHVVLQTAKTIDFRLCDTNPRPIDARGGQGGAGNNDTGGAQQSTNGQKETPAAQDACPTGYPATGQLNGCKGLTDGAGGDGGPGIIQLHTSTGVVGNPSVANADIRLPAASGGTQLTLRELCQPPALCAGGSVGNGTIPADCFMIPTFGRKSRAVSKWIALGEGGFDINTPGTSRNVEFTFGGVNTTTGFVNTTNGVVDAQPSILPPMTIPVSSLPAGDTIVIDASSLAGTSLVQNTELLKHYILQFSVAVPPPPFLSTDPPTYVRYDIVDAVYDSLAQTLTLTVDGDGPALNQAPVNTWSPVHVELQPAFFRIVSRVSTSETADSLPSTATVQIAFEATEIDAMGNPNASTIVGPTSDVSVLNAAPNNAQLRFVRFMVLFDIANGANVTLSPTNPVPSLEFLRLPFRYQ